MRNAASILFLCLIVSFYSCSDDELDITGEYSITIFKSDCLDSKDDFTYISGDNEIDGTIVNFSGSLEFTSNDRLIITENYVFPSFTLFNETITTTGNYELSGSTLTVCMDNDCEDRKLSIIEDKLEIESEEDSDGCIRVIEATKKS